MTYNSPQLRAKNAAIELAFALKQHDILMRSLAAFRGQRVSDTERLRLLNLSTRTGFLPLNWSRPSRNRSMVRWAREVAA